jgi:flagella basal body P-ring formation protein FlgA
MAKVTRLLLLLALAAAPLAAEDAPPARITIRDHALVAGDVVRLRDVADIEGQAPAGLEQLVLGNAPWPGNARQISRVLVKARMISAGLELRQVQFAGADLCAVQAASLRVEPERIATAAQDYVRSFFPAGGPDVSVELEREVMPAIVAAGGEEPTLRAVVPGSGAPVGSVRVDVEILRAGVLLKRVPVNLSVRVYQTVGVAREMIAPGQALTALNVAFTRRDVTDVAGACVDSARELAGRVADRQIAPGQIVTARLAPQPQAPVVIKANQRVFLVVQTPSLRVVTLGKAVGSARQGEVARARNLNTGREVMGTAVDAGIIQVDIGGPNDES